MKIVMVSCFSNKDAYSRGNVIYNYFKNRNDKCFLIYSEFDHGTKTYKKMDDDFWIPVKTIRYKKNFSLNRMISHFFFGMKAASLIKKLKPDLIYVAVPPNAASFFACKVAKKLNLRLIIDIVDLWPESLPISKKIKLFAAPLFKIWKNLRETSLIEANVIMYECDYYKEYLGSNKLLNEKSCTVYLSKLGEYNQIIKFTTCFDDVLNICYIGSINYLIDIDFLINLMIEIKKSKPINLNIIGIGEKKSYLVGKLNEFNISYFDYGAIYDESEKIKIMAKCDFGFNVYNKQAIIGLTYKSVDYLYGGLPLINSIKGDTWKMVEERKIGINVNPDDYIYSAKLILDLGKEEIEEMKKNVVNTYVDCFSYATLERNMDLVVDMAFK